MRDWPGRCGAEQLRLWPALGSADLPDRFTRTDPIPHEALEAYAEELRAGGRLHEVEARYGDLKSALRRLLR